MGIIGKQYKLNTNRAAIIIPLTAVVVAASAVAGVFFYLKEPAKTKDISLGDPVNTVSGTSDGTKKDYISETNYKGYLSQYPELYEIPFSKSDAYICNKDFYREHYEIFDECKDDATAFIEALFNVNYREIAANKDAFVADVMQNGDYETYVTKDFGKETEKTMYLYNYIEELSEYFIDNQVEMESRFYTDDSLIYSDFYTFVRGELVFTIYNSEDENSEYKVGQEYQIPIEVAMQRSNADPANRTVCSFGKAEDNTFFLTP